jgi:hypothetical protein
MPQALFHGARRISETRNVKLSRACSPSLRRAMLRKGRYWRLGKPLTIRYAGKEKKRGTTAGATYDWNAALKAQNNRRQAVD